MFEQRSLKLPIALGVVMIVLLVLLTAGWILLTVFGAVANNQSRSLYITLLSVGTVLLVIVLVGVVMYLTFSIQTINVNRRQSNFVDSVTHELKSPIASLKLYLQTLNRHQVSGAERDHFYRFMLEDVERLDHLINHLLDAGRLDKKAVDGELERIDMASLLGLCAESICLRYRISTDHVRVDTQTCNVLARRVDMDMIFRNLVDNAVKYAGDEPRVGISLRRDSSRWIEIQISDNGRGIPMSQRRKIFGRFVRLGLELERDKPGTGLGLYIVRTLVRRLGGRIRVQDPDEGPGTVFVVYLPTSLILDEESSTEEPVANTRVA